MFRLLHSHNLITILCIPAVPVPAAQLWVFELKFRLAIVQTLRMRGAVLHGHYISSQRGAKLGTGKILTLLFEDYSPIFMNIITFQSSITILLSSPTPKAFSRPVMSFRSFSKSQSWPYIDPEL